MFNKYRKSKSLLELPLCNNQYLVSLEGKVFDVEGKEITPTVDSEGNLRVKLNWLKGLQEYLVAEVIAHTYKPLQCPNDLCGQIRLLFKDGDSKNIHHSNLVWKFPVRLESKVNPGYYYIPCFSRYVMNLDGEFIDEHSEEQLDRLSYSAGYVRLSLKHDCQKWSSIGRHRAIALVFLDYPVNMDDLAVNHIDGVPGNDSLENLEIVTNAENNRHAHAAGLVTNGIPITATSVTTGKALFFQSVKQCATALKVSSSLVMKAVVADHPMLIAGNYFLEAEDERQMTRKYYGYQAVLTRDVKTGEVNEYRSRKAAQRALHLGPLAIITRLDFPNQPVFHDGLQMKYRNDPTPWRDPSEDELKLFQVEATRRVLTRDVRTNEIKEHASLVLCGDALGLSKDAIAWRVYSEGQPVFPEYLQYKLKVDQTPWREVTDIAGEIELYGRQNHVLVKDLKTGEVKEFAKQADCARYMNIADSTFSIWLAKKGQPVLPGLFQLKLKHDSEEWRYVENPQEEYLDAARLYKSVLMRDVRTGEVTLFETAKACADNLGILTTTFNWRLKSNGQKTYPPGLQFKYRGDPTPWYEPAQ